MGSALAGQCLVCHTNVECESTGHAPVVVQCADINREEEASKLQLVVYEFVLQPPGRKK